jgi:aryl-alcohol dehydrogenase-like predicted oxidoreductase
MILTIGSAQFGLKYGFKNKKIKKKDLKKILKTLQANKLKYFDTATNYDDSEKIIGNLKIHNKKIITKIKLPKKKLNIEKWYKQQISNSLKNLKVKKLYGLMFHDTSDFINNKSKFLKLMLESKKNKFVSNIGISVYDIKEVENILKFWVPDIIQFPLNIFDQRFLNKNFLNKAKKLKIKLYARSCFLQGNLLQKKLLIGNKKSKKIFNSFKYWCNINKKSQLSACVHFVKQNKQINSIVVGFDDNDELKQITSEFKKKTFYVPLKFIINEKKIIDPRKW